MSAVGILASAILGIARFFMRFRRRPMARKGAGQLRSSEPPTEPKTEAAIGGAEGRPAAASPGNGPDTAEFHHGGVDSFGNSHGDEVVPGAAPQAAKNDLPDEVPASSGVADPALLEAAGELSAGDADGTLALPDSGGGHDWFDRNGSATDAFPGYSDKANEVFGSELADPVETGGGTAVLEDEPVIGLEPAADTGVEGAAARNNGSEEEADRPQADEELTDGISGNATVPPNASAGPSGRNAVSVEESGYSAGSDAVDGAAASELAETAVPKPAGDALASGEDAVTGPEDVADPGGAVAAVAPERGGDPCAAGRQTSEDLNGNFVGDAAVSPNSAVDPDRSGMNATSSEGGAFSDAGAPVSEAASATSSLDEAAASSEEADPVSGVVPADGGGVACVPEAAAEADEDSASSGETVPLDGFPLQPSDHDLESGLPEPADSEPPGGVAGMKPGGTPGVHGAETESVPQERPGDASPAGRGAGDGNGRGPVASKQTERPGAGYGDRRGRGGRPGTPRTQAATGARRPAPLEIRLLRNERLKRLELSIVLKRPGGYPDRIAFADGLSTSAYDDSRYDDLQLPVTAQLLDDHIRVSSEGGNQWLRRKRGVHVFAKVPGERGMMTCGAVRIGGTFFILCRSDDEPEVFAAAAAAGSPEPVRHKDWRGLPDGWSLFGNFMPRHASRDPTTGTFSVLDPGQIVDVEFSAGLQVRHLQFTADHPPSIRIEPVRDGVEVMIDDETAVLQESGWQAPGWDAPGDHFVDVNPGPVRKYTILEDPAVTGIWEFWDAHPVRFSEDAPWASAQICGGAIRGSSGEAVIAAETRRVLVALGVENTAKKLTPRPVVGVSVAQSSVPLAYLVSATGFRRKHGSVIWLGSLLKRAKSADPDWAREIHEACSRRWPLERADGTGKRAWRNAVRRARNLRRKLR